LPKVPKGGWPERGVTINVARGMDRERQETLTEHNIPISVLEAKANISSLIERDYYLGDVLQADEITDERGRPHKIRRFDPTNVLLQGGFEKGSCPILYVEWQKSWRRVGPVLIDAVGSNRVREDRIRIENRSRRFKLVEEEMETSTINGVHLVLTFRNGSSRRLDPQQIRSTKGSSFPQTIRKGEEMELEFVDAAGDQEMQRVLVVSGFYAPDSALTTRMADR
jgi:hypothetical protein